MSIPSPKRGVLLSDPSHVNGGVRRGPARKPVDETNFGVRRRDLEVIQLDPAMPCLPNSAAVDHTNNCIPDFV